MKKLKFLSWAFLAMTLSLTACSDSDEPAPDPTLEVSQSSTMIPAEGGKVTVNVNSNTDWSVSTDANWLKVVPAGGNGTAVVELTAEANESYDSRIANVTVKHEADGKFLSKNFTVQQAGKAKPTYHFDLMVSVGGTTGMGSSGVTSTLIRNLTPDEVEDANNTISFKGIGVDIQAEINSEAIIKNGYYYEAAPLSNSWYGKYIVNDNQKVQTVNKFEMGSVVFKAKQYTHAWIADNTLVFLGADKAVSNRGSNKATSNTIMWSRVKDNGNALSMEAEGVLDLTTPTKEFKEGGVTAFSTTGLATYRASDNTIIYAFVDNDLTAKTLVKGVFVAFIDPATMEVKKVIKDDRAETLSGTAYGELQQDKMFFDENGDLYIAGENYIATTNSTSSTSQYGRILRIKKDATEFDKDYLGYDQYQDGKILSMDYLGGGKIAMTMQDPVKTGLSASRDYYAGWSQNDISTYYVIYDIASGKATDLSEIPFSSGSFSDRVAVVNGKCYIASSPDTSKEQLPAIYIYDIASGKLTKGANIEAGFYINRLNVVDNLK
ncbi:MAG: hypothetical protein MJZ83_09540 [Bacteroidaceae bacterium]|nr:hypothetical protein [Bacteroidaceae bacterium]